ncbi:pirin family protein [Mucilaginibacter arboris]|uniref:Quercetin 2,3-dioxygenase C-terminal cupin domain-containing protein n=1 Tax=Mucilaginibacter arboris TaxID=2682090 RepID=A0A7K1T0G2_9SPHI|nr:hypothetical protein [Mucilaginibacter arboris]MVN23056.1 hypothetical protein [Mucilaginibacter arboris]
MPLKTVFEMDAISHGQIYLADQRGVLETSAFRRYSTFNYAGYFEEHRKAFDKLEVLNDQILAANRSVNISFKQSEYIIIIPITGEVIYKGQNSNAVTVDAGQIFIKYQSTGSAAELINPFEGDWINFLHLQLKADTKTDILFSKMFGFDLDATSNKLIKVVTEEDVVSSAAPFSIYIGRFEGRKDALLKLKNKSSQLFAFVIHGAFELQGRLMHERDGLALWELEEADLEALSNQAIILIIEMAGENIAA